MSRSLPLAFCVFAPTLLFAQPEKKLYREPLNIQPKSAAEHPDVKIDYDIIYVRAPRKDPTGRSKWAEVGDPRSMEPGADLMLLHPDGKEEVLVLAEGNESIAAPFVSFDGKSIFFAKFQGFGNTAWQLRCPIRKGR